MSLLPGAAISSGGYNINNSLRFRRSASAYLSRTPAVAGNSTTFTISVWVKRGQLSVDQNIYFGGVGNEATTGYRRTALKFNNTDTLEFQEVQSNVGAIAVSTTSAVFRDPSAWYHIVAQVDTTQATSTNRVRLYVNGVQQTIGTLTAYSQNYTTQINTTQLQQLGRAGSGTANHLDGYLAEAYLIDGQALSASSFGETNATTGVWQPKQYTGTYGTNGFYLKFSNIALTSGSNTGLGQDFSGNGNFYNTTNISVTAGTTYDAMIDSPTLTSATVANYPVLNPISKGTDVTISNGNLSYAVTALTNCGAFATVGMSSGKWYCEFTAQGNDCMFGLALAVSGQILYLGVNAFSWGYYRTGNKYNNGTNTAYGAAFTTNDVIGITFDADIGTLVFYKNNVSQGAAFTGLTSGPYFFAVGNGNIANSIAAANFGQRPFVYTPPAGFVRLNTYNLPNSTIVKGNSYMDATTYTGNSVSPTSITNAASFRPDFVWIKNRTSGTAWHNLIDSNRGASKTLFSNQNVVEQTNDANGYLSAFNSNGFAVTTGASSFLNVNTTGNNYVAWQWQAGQGTNTTNTNGSITSTVSVNATAGFSVVTYTGTGANATVGHGLGVAPAMVIVKRRDSTGNWQVRHTSIAVANSIQLNLTNASAAATTVWNSTAPTSSVFSIGTSTDVNANTGTYVAYCWSEIAGFSRFGSYTGNGNADGPFVYTGFRPKFLLTKNINTGAVGDDWFMFDSTRNPFNLTNLQLIPNLSLAEAVGTTNVFDLVSNGFKTRGTAADTNGNGNTIIYAAFAENPFKNALAI